MVGVAENVNVRVTLTSKNQRLKWHVGGNDFWIERLQSSNYQATFPLRCVNFILTATACGSCRSINRH